MHLRKRLRGAEGGGRCYRGSGKPSVCPGPGRDGIKGFPGSLPNWSVHRGPSVAPVAGTGGRPCIGVAALSSLGWPSMGMLQGPRKWSSSYVPPWLPQKRGLLWMLGRHLSLLGCRRVHSSVMEKDTLSGKTQQAAWRVGT